MFPGLVTLVRKADIPEDPTKTKQLTKEKECVRFIHPYIPFVHVEQSWGLVGSRTSQEPHWKASQRPLKRWCISRLLQRRHYLFLHLNQCELARGVYEYLTFQFVQNRKSFFILRWFSNHTRRQDWVNISFQIPRLQFMSDSIAVLG